MRAHLVGLLAGIVASVLFIAMLLQKRVIDMTFDERQERARGVAFQYGFYTMVIAVVFYGALDLMVGKWCDTLVGCILCVCVGMTVFAVTCIRKDAYLSLKEKPKQIMTMLAGLALLNLLFGVMAYDNLVQNGILTFWATNPVVGMMALIILVAYILQYRSDRQEERE